MKTLKTLLVGALLLVSAATFAHAGAGTSLVIDPNGAGDSLIDITLEELGTGKQVSLAKLAEKKVVMLEFWATWCNICKVEIPTLVKEYKEWKDKGYLLVAITLSDGGERDIKKIEELREKHGITYPILLDTKYEAAKLFKLSGPIPLKLIADCKGKLRYENVGGYPDGVSEVPFVLEQLLAEPACKK